MVKRVRMQVKPDTRALFTWFDRILDPAINASVIEAQDRTGDDILEVADKLVPVDEGDLRSTLRKGMVKRKGKIFAVMHIMAGGMKGKVTGKTVDYAGYQEHGTIHMKPSPYIRPSIRKGIKNFNGHFLVAFKRRVPR